MLWWLLACMDDGRVADRPRGAVGDALWVGEALDCDVSREPGKDADGSGEQLHRVELTGAVCADGTPAGMFVRGALDPEASGRWVIQFEGGGSCVDGPECVERWCGTGRYDARKMSSQWSPNVLKQHGIANPSPQNAFGGWNHVFVAYCSSDMWQGQRQSVLTVDGVSFRVAFEGALIVDAVFAALLDGVVSDDGVQTLPPLAQAAEVVVAGSSAGGMGVIAHLDRFAEDLPGAEVWGVIDALYTPDAALAGVSDAFLAENKHLWDDAFVPLYDGRPDASCAAAELQAPYRCIDPGYVQQHHVSTPFLLHHDLFDPPLSAQFVALGASREGYASASEASIERLAAARPDVAVHGSACGQHTVLGASDWFFVMSVDDGLRPWTTHEAMQAFRDGERVVAIDAPDAASSSCIEDEPTTPPTVSRPTGFTPTGFTTMGSATP